MTARDVAKVQDLADAHPDRALALALDVTDPAAVVLEAWESTSLGTSFTS